MFFEKISETTKNGFSNVSSYDYDKGLVLSILNDAKYAEKFCVGKEAVAGSIGFNKHCSEDALFMGKTAPFIKTPYEKCWIELDFDDVLKDVLKNTEEHQEEPVDKAAYYVRRLDDDKLLVAAWIHLREAKVWLPPFNVYLIKIGAAWRPYEVMNINVFGIKPKNASNHYDGNLLSRATVLKGENHFDDDVITLKWLQISLLMLTAKNVFLKRIHARVSKSSKKKKNRGRERNVIYSHHILMTRIENKYRERTESSGEVMELPLHSVRATFAFYTEERPLFGTPGNCGFIFKPEHERGDIRFGNVTKNYRVIS
jgi:hypothetical protein